MGGGGAIEEKRLVGPHLPEAVVRGVCPEHQEKAQGSRHYRVGDRGHLSRPFPLLWSMMIDD